MIPLHEALTNALTRCHLFDQHGALVPFVFVAELTALARVRARFGDTFAVPEFPRARIGDDFRRERQKVIRMSPGDRVMTAALTGPDAGSALVPDEVVREAWCRAAPWMHVSLPDWWAFKVRLCASTRRGACMCLEYLHSGLCRRERMSMLSILTE